MTHLLLLSPDFKSLNINLWYSVINNVKRAEQAKSVKRVLSYEMACRYGDSLRAGRSGDRIPVGARFSAPVQIGRGAHPASYTMGTVSFQGVKRP